MNVIDSIFGTQPRARKLRFAEARIHPVLNLTVIRNPWLFRQIREQRRGAPVFCPTGRDVLEYVHALYEAVSTPGIRESAQINNMKKYMNFIGWCSEPYPQSEIRNRFGFSTKSAAPPPAPISSRSAASSSITTNRCRSSPSRSR